MAERRKDSKGRVLKDGESERQQGGYQFRWSVKGGARRYIYAKTLEELREKEQDVIRDKSDGIRTDSHNTTVNDVYDMWCSLKKGLKDNTFQNYKYMYEQFVRPDFGMLKVASLKRSDVRRYYNRLFDERQLKIATIDSIHTVLHQVLDLAVEDCYLRNNPSDKALKELKQSRNLFTEKKKSLTLNQQNLLIDFLRRNPRYNHWYPFVAFMLGTGLRVGEATGLRWEDVDFEDNTISVNHTLVYYDRSDRGCGYAINTPKTRAGTRIVPMMESVRDALMKEREYQMEVGIRSTSVIDGFQDFIFVNRFGHVQNQSTLNKAIRRIMRDCNQEIIDKTGGKENMELLPRFSCHTLRHTFATRLCEANVNIKVIQTVLGHSDINTTMDVYTDATRNLQKREFVSFEDFLNVEDKSTC